MTKPLRTVVSSDLCDDWLHENNANETKLIAIALSSLVRHDLISILDLGYIRAAPPVKSLRQIILCVLE